MRHLVHQRAPPPGFLLQSRFGGAPLKLRLHLVEWNAGGMEQHEQMVEHVGGFRPEPFAIARCRGDCRLDSLLAEFAGAMGDALAGERAV